MSYINVGSLMPVNSHLQDIVTVIGFRGEEIKDKTNSALIFNLSAF
jgi:hypothetical protein